MTYLACAINQYGSNLRGEGADIFPALAKLPSVGVVIPLGQVDVAQLPQPSPVLLESGSGARDKSSLPSSSAVDIFSSPQQGKESSVSPCRAAKLPVEDKEAMGWESPADWQFSNKAMLQRAKAIKDQDWCTRFLGRGVSDDSYVSPRIHPNS